MSRTKQQTTWRLGLLLGLGLFVLSALAARGDSLGLLETRLFTLFFNLPDGLRPILLLVTQLGSGWFLVVLSLVLLVRRQPLLARKVFVAGALTFALAQLAKMLVGRPRPVLLLPDIIQREFFVTGMGFPSGHTALATALSLTLLLHLPPRWRFLVPLWIIAVGFSRLYLGVHAPLDIIGGFAIGLFVASAFQVLIGFRQRK